MFSSAIYGFCVLLILFLINAKREHFVPQLTRKVKLESVVETHADWNYSRTERGRCLKHC